MVAIAIVMLAAGNCAGGISHEIGWKFERDQPLIKRENRREVLSK